MKKRLPKLVSLPIEGGPFILQQVAIHKRCISVLRALPVINRKLINYRKRIDELRDSGKPMWSGLAQMEMTTLIRKWEKLGKARTFIQYYYIDLMYSTIAPAVDNIHGEEELPEAHENLAAAI